jgi:hypothetical protein
MQAEERLECGLEGFGVALPEILEYATRAVRHRLFPLLSVLTPSPTKRLQANMGTAISKDD